MADIRSELKERLNMDLDKALQELGLPQRAFERVAKVSLMSTVPTLEAMEAAISGGDMDGIKRGAHELKGVFMNLRLAALAEPAKQMEELIKSGAPLGEVGQQLDVLRAQFAILKDIFK